MSQFYQYFKNLNIKLKLQLGFSILLIVSITLGSSLIYYFIKKSIGSQLESELRNSNTAIVNMVRTVAKTSIKVHLKSIAEQNKLIVNNFYNIYKHGIITESAAKASAGRELLKQKIGKTGYIFVWDIRIAPKNIPLAVHPLIQGQDVAYVDFVQRGAEERYGYIEYEWANPGEKTKRKKSMYLAYFEPW